MGSAELKGSVSTLLEILVASVVCGAGGVCRGSVSTLLEILAAATGETGAPVPIKGFNPS